jgi:DNA-binding SARP family transcriptional activator
VYAPRRVANSGSAGVVELRVLGPLTVLHDGVAREFARARPRELLELLATRPNQATSPQRLIDELWDGAPPPTASSALRVHIGHVRRVLEPRNVETRSARLALESGAYVLRLDSNELDSLRFQELAASGHEANLRGDVRAANEDLSAALRCWRGAAFPDIRGLASAGGAIARLEQLRASALEELADVRLALGEPATVIDLLVDEVEEYPLHERLSGQLMLALYRCGRQAEALRVFANLAQRLDEQLGLQPCPEVRQLEEDILLQCRHLDLSSRSSRSVAGTRAHPEPARLIGRRTQLGRLLELHDEARTGNRRLALVSGAAGIGKTALVRAYCERAQRAGATVLVGRCAPPPERGYGAIIQALTNTPLSRETVREDVFDVLSLLRGEGLDARADDPAPSAHDPSSDVLHLLESIARVIGSLTPPPLVLVIEDLHWADRATMQVLRHLLRHPELDYLFVVVTSRDEELDTDRAERIARLAPPMHLQRLELAGFDVHEVRALIRATVAQPATALLLDFAATLTDATGGNPLHVRALLRELDEMVLAGAGRDELQAAVTTLAPAGLRVLVDRRLDRLSTNAKHVLNAAAALDDAIRAALLVEICDLSAGALRESIEELLDSRFLNEHDWHVDHYEFQHAAVRNVVYVGMADDQRTRLHLRIAKVLEACDSRREPRYSAEIAHHYAAASPLSDPGKVADYARHAGDEAAASLSFAEAAAWYERVLRAWVAAGRPVSSSGAVELALGQAYEADRQFSQARTAFMSGAAHALESGDTALYADLAVAASGPWTSGLDDQAEARDLLENALVCLGDHDPARRLDLLTALASSIYFVDAEREGRLVEEALQLSTALADAARSSNAHLAQHLWLTHDPEARRDRLSITKRALELAIESRSPRLELRARRELLTDLLENAEADDFESALACYERLASERCSPRDIYWSMALRATHATLRGDLVAAEQLARGAQLRGRELHQESAGAEVLQRFVIRYQQGRLAEEVGPLLQMGTGKSLYRAGSGLGALASAETGRTTEGARIARWAIGPDGRSITRDAFWLGAHALFAGVAATANDTELAEQLIPVLASCADHVVVFGAGGAVLGCGHHWLGLLETTCHRWDRAAEHLAEAERVSAGLGAPYWRAQAQIDLAHALRLRGYGHDAQTASSLIDEAVSSSQRYGYGRLLVRAMAVG